MKKFLLNLVAGLLTAVLAVALTGCMPEEYILRHDPESVEPVRIAVILPETGDNYLFGIGMRRGIEYALDELNCSRGIEGREISVLFIDNQSTPEGAEAAMEQAAQEGAEAVILGYDSREVQAAAPLAKTLRLPSVVPLATADDISSGNGFVFRNCYTDSQQAEALAAYLWYWRKFVSVAVMVNMADDGGYSQSIARDFAQSFKEFGGTIAITAEFVGDDYEEAIQQVISTQTSAILIPASATRSVGIVKRLRECGYKGVLCGPDTWDDDDFLRLFGKNYKPGLCAFSAFFSRENTNVEYKKFRDGFRKRYFMYPGAVEAQSYDALILLADSLSGTKDLYKFTENWQAIRKRRGAAAIYSMLPRGEIDRSIYINNIRPGDEIRCPTSRLDKIIFPSKVQFYKESNFAYEDSVEESKK